MRKYQILFNNGGVAELVGFYSGANKKEGLPIFKIEDKYYLEQNPTTSSIFAAFARRRQLVYWELNEYPDRTMGLKYTGRIVIFFQLLKTPEVKSYINQIIEKESNTVKFSGKKQEIVQYA